MSISVIGEATSEGILKISPKPTQANDSPREALSVGISGTGEGSVSISKRAVSQVGGTSAAGPAYDPSVVLHETLNMMNGYGGDAVKAGGGFGH